MTPQAPDFVPFAEVTTLAYQASSIKHQPSGISVCVCVCVCVKYALRPLRGGGDGSREGIAVVRNEWWTRPWASRAPLVATIGYSLPDTCAFVA